MDNPEKLATWSTQDEENLRTVYYYSITNLEFRMSKINLQ